MPTPSPSPASLPSPAFRLETLHRDYHAALLAYVTGLTRDRHAAEDIVQETFLRAWQNGASFHAYRGSFRPWLNTVARNLVIDRARAQACRPVEAAMDDLGVEPTYLRLPDHASAVVTTELSRNLLSSLSVDHRAVVVMVYWYGHSLSQAAQVLGIPVGTAKSRLSHALGHLRLLADDVLHTWAA